MDRDSREPEQAAAAITAPVTITSRLPTRAGSCEEMPALIPIAKQEQQVGGPGLDRRVADQFGMCPSSAIVRASSRNSSGLPAVSSRQATQTASSGPGDKGAAHQLGRGACNPGVRPDADGLVQHNG
jgi:hypothetical protein